MECLYRQHLILPVAFFDSAIGDWTASVHIEFTEKLKIHTVVLKFGDAFETEVQAKRFTIKEAKQWVDHRLRGALLVKPNRIHVSSAISRSKQALHWICRQCKNNSHDLCLKIATSRAGSDAKIRCWCSLQPTHELRLHDKSPAQMVNPRKAR
jgi:hypothetical protein